MPSFSTLPALTPRPIRRAALTAGLLTFALAGRSNAQQAATPDSSQAVQVSPHQILFTGDTKTASLAIQNPGDRPRTIQILVEFGYIDWPHGLPYDTVLIAPNMDVIEPHDTIVANPGPHDHYAGRWLSGLPTQFTLAAHETKHVAVHFNPPASLPAGEYWARIVARVSPTDPNHGHNLDVQKKYALPTKGHMANLQDTCAIVYRTGDLRMGLAIGPTAKAVIDSANIGGAGHDNFSHALWVRLPIKVTGNAPFTGQMQSTYQNLTTGEVVRPNTKEYSIFKDGVMHWVVETDVLSPGKYTLTVEFNNQLAADSTELPKLPMTPAKVVFPFEVKPAWAY